MSLRFRSLLIPALLLPFAGCGGGGGGSAAPPAATPSFTLAVSPASLQIPAGASGFVTISVARLNGFQGAVTVAGVGFPAGATLSGTLGDGASSLQLPVVVGLGVGQTSFPNLQVEGRSGALTRTAPFSLTVKAPLAQGLVGVDLTQASGGRQQAGTTVNQTVVLEPLRATTSASAGGSLQIRHGYLPSGAPATP